MVQENGGQWFKDGISGEFTGVGTQVRHTVYKGIRQVKFLQQVQKIDNLLEAENNKNLIKLLFSCSL